MLAAGSTAAPATRRRILVVEDDPEAAQFFRHVLTRRGQFLVTHVADPARALALVAAEPWDLVLTDLDLPVMSGVALLAELHQVKPGLPVILVTAHALGACPALALGIGQADAVLVKPVPADRLLAAVNMLT